MTTTEFNRLVSRRWKLSREVLQKKGGEYAGPVDRLHNFKRAAELSETTPERALWGMMAKHLVSIRDIVDTVPVRDYSREHIDEKIGDAINYLILLDGLLTERLGDE